MVSIFNLLSKANNLNYYLEKHFEEIGSFEGLYNLKNLMKRNTFEYNYFENIKLLLTKLI